MVSTALALLALAGRVALLGYERIVAKQLAAGRSALGATFLFMVVGGLLWSPALLWSGLLPARILGYATLASVFYAAAFVLYMAALSRSDASLIGPLYHTSILVVIVLSALVLDEAVTWLRGLGGFLLLYGVTMLRQDGSPWALVRGARRIWEDAGARLMLAGAALLGAGRIVDKYLIEQVAEVSLAAFQPAIAYAIIETVLVVVWLSLALWVTGGFRDTLALTRERPREALLAGGVNLASYALLLVAFMGLDVSIADPASSLSMLVTVLLAGAFFDEPWRKRLPAAALMCAGAWLLFQ